MSPATRALKSALRRSPNAQGATESSSSSGGGGRSVVFVMERNTVKIFSKDEEEEEEEEDNEVMDEGKQTSKASGDVNGEEEDDDIDDDVDGLSPANHYQYPHKQHRPLNNNNNSTTTTTDLVNGNVERKELAKPGGGGIGSIVDGRGPAEASRAPLLACSSSPAMMLRHRPRGSVFAESPASRLRRAGPPGPAGSLLRGAGGLSSAASWNPASARGPMAVIPRVSPARAMRRSLYQAW